MATPIEKQKALTPYLELHLSGEQQIRRLIQQELAGRNPMLETALRRFFLENGINTYQDILHGNPTPFDVRKFWQELGMDPDSENEVLEFINAANQILKLGYLVCRVDEF